MPELTINRVYVTERLSGRKARTPEGFLLCEGVAIARTGVMLYGPGETPIQPGPDGITRISRDPEEVFRPETIASFNGKPITIGHPPDDPLDPDAPPVHPSNWREFTVGVVLNPRRGTGLEDQLLLADLLIQDQYAIEEVEAGKREVSCGYDARYREDETRPGYGWQVNIIGNHLALVDSARCGSVCRIKDAAYHTRDEGGIMQKPWIQKIVAAVKGALGLDDAGAKKVEEALSSVHVTDEGGEGVHLHMGRTKFTDEALEERFKGYDEKHKAFDAAINELQEKQKAQGGEEEKAVEGELEEEAPVGTGDKARKAKDSAYFVDSFKETVAGAEVLLPGVTAVTLDHRADPKQSLRQLTRFRMDVLRQAIVKDQKVGEIVRNLRQGRDLTSCELEGMSIAKVRDLFNSTVVMKKQQSQLEIIPSAAPIIPQGAKIKSISDLNRRNQEFYKN